MTKFVNLVLILINISLAVSGQFSIKVGMKQVGYISSNNFLPLLLKSLTNLYVILGLLAYTLAAVTWILVLSRVDLSYAYPMLSLGYIIILLLGIFFLNETVGFSRIMGTVFIIMGVFLIFRS